MWEIVERHFEEAEFLAELWRDALDQPDFTLAELADTSEARLWAHLEGLYLQGPKVLVRLLWPALDGTPDTAKALVAGLGVLSQGDEADCARLGAVLEDSEVGDERWTGVVEALALSLRPGLDKWLVGQLDGRVGSRIAGLAHALARRRTELGDTLDPLLESEDPAVLAVAARLARLGSPMQLASAATLGRHEDQRVVAEAIETALVRGVKGSVDAARYWAFEAPDHGFRRRALVWMALLDHAGDLPALLALLDDPKRRTEALWAVGFSGRVEAVHAAMRWLDDERAGPLAGEVMSAIVGLPAEEDSLWLDPQQDDNGLPALADDPLDADLDQSPEELLPVPDLDAFASWWATHEARFDPRERYLAGAPMGGDSLRQSLFEQPLRRRHVLALLVELRTRGATALSTRDWATRQLAELEQLRLS